MSQPSLTLWRDLTPIARRLRDPCTNSAHILVIGGGVTGLVTSWVLLDQGYHVTVLSKNWANDSKDDRLTSQIAGALWEYPPAVCGLHTNVISLEHSKRWCMVAYHIFQGIASIPSLSRKSGVKMLPSAFFYRSPIENRKQEHGKMMEIMASGVRGFRRDHTRLVDDNHISKSYGIADAYELQSPVIDTDKATHWLMSLVRGKGATLITETIEQDLLEIEGSLLQRFNADAIVNATGLGSSVLAGDDTVYPIRGGLLRMINDGSDFPKVRSALTITSPENPSDIVFLVPRNDDILIVGGFTEPHEWSLDLTPDSPVVRRMKERCEKFLPGLKNARLDENYPLAQGLRPFRGENVRVERELRIRGSRIVHNYGQGGAGWSLSFGCAQDVLKLVNEALAGLPARPMADSGNVIMQSRL